MKLSSLINTATLAPLLAATGALARPVRFHAVHARANDISDEDIERLTPQFGVTRGIPIGSAPGGDCRGVRNAEGQIVAIPCACPPDRAEFLELVTANVRAGFVLKNPDVKDLKFPLDDSKESRLDRLHVATVSLQSITGPGIGCPNAGTTWGALEAAIRAGTDTTDGTGTAAVPATFTGTLAPSPTGIPPASTTEAPAPTNTDAPPPADDSPPTSTEQPSDTGTPSPTGTGAPSTDDGASDSPISDEPSATTTNAPASTTTNEPASTEPDDAPATSTDTPTTGINPPASSDPAPPTTTGAPSTTDAPTADPTSTPAPPASGGGAGGSIDTNLSDADIARLAPSLGWRAGINPDGTGNCDGAVLSTNVGEDGKKLPIIVPCACPPSKEAFLQALTANIRAGRVVNNPGIPAAFTFPTGDSVDDQLARITAASATLQNLNGEGQGCPMASTTLVAQAAAIREGKPLPKDRS
ncbi:hypothetical protein AURDEDRAFT_112060 [Auricularia subglabra TFB-10046 SS5]|nr:hypothetical protein AURDEDRAFT_112060 [Auricularia subglabra TFB-10046 SS5]